VKHGGVAKNELIFSINLQKSIADINIFLLAYD